MKKLKSPDFAELIPFLQGLSAVAVEKAPAKPKAKAAAAGFDLKGLDLAQILALIQQYGPLISMLVALIKGASGGGAGKPGQLPPVPEPEPDEEPAPPETPGPPDIRPRTVVGVRSKWFHFMEGKPGQAKAMPKKRFDEVLAGSNIYGPDKTRLVADVTPLMDDGQPLRQGDPENSLLEVQHTLIVDGTAYVGDAIRELGSFAGGEIVLNNLQTANGMLPRVEIKGLSGQHTITLTSVVNGKPSNAIETLRIDD